MNEVKQRPYLVLLSTLILLITGLITFGITSCVGDTLTVSDVYGVSYAISFSDAATKADISSELNKLDKDGLCEYEKTLTEREKKLYDYYYAVLYHDGDVNALNHWSLIQPKRIDAAAAAYNEYSAANSGIKPENYSSAIESQLKRVGITLEMVREINSFSDYSSTVTKQAEALSGITVFSSDRFLLSNIIKTQRDYYGLDGIRLSAVSDDGVMLLINSRIADIFAVLIIVMSLTLSAFTKTRATAGLQLLTLPLVGIAALYIGCALIVGATLGLPPLDVSVQSLSAFRSCTQVISLGTFALLALISKLCGGAVLLLAGATLLALRGKKRAVFASCMGAFVLFEALTATLCGDNCTLLREVNLCSLFTPERFLLRYLNLNIFGMAVSRLPLFVGLCLITLIALSITAYRCTKSYYLAATVAAERDYYNEINRRYDESRKIRHDINNHLLAINTLIETGKVDEARHYISEVSEQLDLAVMPLKTGCDVLDALLYKKGETAKTLGITITYDIGCPIKACGISDYDLCSLFGNLIDNALTATEELDDNRVITLTVGRQLSMLYIAAENPYSGRVVRQNDEIVTTKPDKLNHGYGLKRINEVARRYGGYVEITADDGVFRASVLLNV